MSLIRCVFSRENVYLQRYYSKVLSLLSSRALVSFAERATAHCGRPQFDIYAAAIVPREPREIDDEETTLKDDWWQEVWGIKRKKTLTKTRRQRKS